LVTDVDPGVVREIVSVPRCARQTELARVVPLAADTGISSSVIRKMAFTAFGYPAGLDT